MSFNKFYNSVMVFFGAFTKWKRINFNENNIKISAIRESAVRETNQDLQKSIQQLLCDVHEETNEARSLEENLIHGNKRMTSMMARVSLSNARNSIIMIILTLAVITLTVLQFYLPENIDSSTDSTFLLKTELKQITTSIDKINQTMLSVNDTISFNQARVLKKIEAQFDSTNTMQKYIRLSLREINLSLIEISKQLELTEK